MRAILVLGSILMNLSAFSAPLDNLRWQKRPVLVFAPSPDDPRLADQRARFRAEASELKDREMAVIVIAGKEDIVSDFGPEPDANSAEFKNRFGVDDTAFAVILVGKDGGEKFRSDRPVQPDEIFALIDRMPMRRREMRERGQTSG